MMANSSVDPLWRAVMAAEVAATPTRRAEIEAKCLRCHAPMAAIEAELSGTAANRRRFLQAEDTLAHLAADGVSCTLCHQLPGDRLGRDETFSGRLQIGMEGQIFGPHARPFAMPMYRHTGYVPTHGPHTRKSAWCASCHTLVTEALQPDGTATGHMLLEQGPYLEWQNSQFNDESAMPGGRTASCQDCHVPTSDREGHPIRTRIARNPHGFDFPPIGERQPFGRHVFTGGNTLLLSILQAESEPPAAAGYRAAIDETRHFLRERTARVELVRARFHEQRLLVEVAVTNLAGHKLPTAYPSRRVWIRLRVRDAADRVLFASGEFDDRGRMVDDAGNVLLTERAGGPVMPHRSTIAGPDEVPIYEAIMEDAQGDVTYGLLRGARYRKDNRLLPRGWRPDHARGPATQPAGIGEDADFRAGSDNVVYLLDIPPAAGPMRVEATLYFQALGARYAAELFTHDGPEMQAFHRRYEQADARPEVLDQAVRHVDQAPEAGPGA
jgi:hypothetical protein